MGKAARNEQIKMQAATMNNISVALGVGSFLVPVLGLWQHFLRPIEPGLQMAIAVVSYFVTMFIAVVAGFVAMWLHGRAIRYLEKIED